MSRARHLVATGLAAVLCAVAAPVATAEDDTGLLGDLLDPLTPKSPTQDPSQPPPLPEEPPQTAEPPPAAPLVDLPVSPEPGAGRQWSLQATRMTLQSPRLHGTTTTRINGREVHTLRISTTGVVLRDPVQRARLGTTTAGLRIAAESGRIQPARPGGRVEIEVRSLSGTLAVAGQPAVPVLLAAPPLQAELDTGLLQLPELTLTAATVHATSLTGANLAFTGAGISIER